MNANASPITFATELGPDSVLIDCDAFVNGPALRNGLTIGNAVFWWSDPGFSSNYLRALDVSGLLLEVDDDLYNTLPVKKVPEPTSLMLIAMGIAFFAASRLLFSRGKD